MPKANILITGGSGFIGSHLITALEKLNTNILKLPHQLLFEKELKDKIKEFSPDAIYHLAAYGNMSNQKDEEQILSSNVLGTWNLLQAIRDIPYKMFVNFSTSSVLLPHQTFYSATKASGEALCRAFSDELGKPITIIRPYSIYGEGEAEFRFIPTVIKSLIYGEKMELDTEAMHDWIYIDDFITAVLGLNIKGTFNLGTGYSYSNLTIVNKLEKMAGKRLNYTQKTLRNFDNKDWKCPEHNVVSDIDKGLLKTFIYYAKQFTAN